MEIAANGESTEEIPHQFSNVLNLGRGKKWLAMIALSPLLSHAQIRSAPWGGFANDAQHTAVTRMATQPLEAIHWSTPVDLNAPPSGTVFTHYGEISITPNNTVLAPVTSGAGYSLPACPSSDTFEVAAFSGSSGAPLYTLCSDYILPPSDWTPPYGPALSQGKRLYYAGAGGSVYYRDRVDTPTGPNGAAGESGRLVFYGASIYEANASALGQAVQISTPITADSSGNIFFGFVAAAGNPAGLISGIARIAADGGGNWISAAALAGNDSNVTQVALNCAPALSNDEQTVYVAVSGGAEFDNNGYLVSFNATTLAPVAYAPLFDPSTGGRATVSGDSSAAPVVGPDGDVYYGVLESPCCSSHNGRGWMLHFSSSLAVLKTPGSFGWDDTASIVPAGVVAGYTGKSAYLILTKYNNYANSGAGDGVNKMAVLDPNAGMQDEYSTSPVTVMAEVITVTGPTPKLTPGFPNAVKEWCINTAAVDPFTSSAIVNSEDGVVYRWDFATNTLSEKVTVTAGRSEAYGPTAIGPDGSAYTINDSTLFSVGAAAPKQPPAKSPQR